MLCTLLYSVPALTSFLFLESELMEAKKKKRSPSAPGLWGARAQSVSRKVPCLCGGPVTPLLPAAAMLCSVQGGDDTVLYPASSKAGSDLQAGVSV